MKVMIYPPSHSLRVVELENALCNQDKLLCKVFCKNKKLNLSLKLLLFDSRTMISAKPCDNCTMIMVNYAHLWLLHSRVTSLLNGVRLELRELKAHSRLLGACTSCRVLRSDLEASTIEIKDLKHRLDHASRYSVLSPLCELCGSLQGKLFHATKENIELQQEVAYLTARLEKTVLSEKMVEDDLSRVEESATKSIYKLGVGFERCEDKGEKSASKFIPNSTYHQEEKTIKSTKAHYPSNPKPSFNPKREMRKETPKQRDEAFVCMFCGHVGHLDEFCFRRKRIERRHFDYTRNSYRDEFSDFLPHSFSCTLPHTSSRNLPLFAHGPNHRSYGFGSRENRFEPRRFGYGSRLHRGDRFLHRPVFHAGGSHTHLEPRHLNGPYFPRRGSRPTRSSSEVLKIVKTSSGRMVKCWITKIYLTNPSTKPLTFSCPLWTEVWRTSGSRMSVAHDI
jgi:hypothetical protein